MKHKQSYLDNAVESPVLLIVAGIDQDVELSEDILMLGLGIVMMSSFFAPIAPPNVLLPLVALTFIVSVTVARRNYHRMEQRLLFSMQQLEGYDASVLKPIANVFQDYPVELLEDSFNPIKNFKRTLKSCLGGLLINPFWMPIFYVMGLQINEEKSIAALNKAIISVEKKINRFG